MFGVTRRLILEHTAEILNVSTIEWAFSPWTRSTLLHDQVDESRSTRPLRLRLMLEKNANKKGQINSENFNSPTLTENYLEVMKKPIEFERNISHDLRHWKSSKRPKRICKIQRLIQNILKGESSSCQCSMTSMDKEIQKYVY